MFNRSEEYRGRFMRKIPLLTGTYLASSAYWLYGLMNSPVETQLISASLAASLYIIGTIADLKTTLDALKLGAHELNPTLPTYPTKSELLNKRQLIKDASILAIGMLFPPLGISLGASRISSAKANQKAIQEYLA